MDNIKGILAPKGFKALGEHIGIKKTKKDLSIVYSEQPATFAGVFTTNKVKAAPVLWDMNINDTKDTVSAIITTSGNANACTGEQGKIDNNTIATKLSEKLNLTPEEILVCATGVIGLPLPMDKIINGIDRSVHLLDRSEASSGAAAEAIMTTDTFTKTIDYAFKIKDKTIKIGGMAKGSGMIHPNMATMLSFITTDCNISKDMLQKAISKSTTDTYNMISVDGDTSTNDTLLILANGMACNDVIAEENEDYEEFCKALDFVNKDLAIKIVKDGEGATKLMEVTVQGSKTVDDGKKIVKSVISSSLFKSALFGADANWGRVLCAMGYSDGNFDVDNVKIVFKSFDENDISQEIILMENSKPIPFDEDVAKEVLSSKVIYIYIILDEGNYSATGWGCDLTYDYVKINGDYRS